MKVLSRNSSFPPLRRATRGGAGNRSARTKYTGFGDLDWRGAAERPGLGIAASLDRSVTIAAVYSAETLDLPASDHSPRHAYFRPEPIWPGKPGVSDAGDRDTEQERRESSSSSTTRANRGARQSSILALN